MKYKALVHVYNLFIYLSSIHSFFHSFIYTFIYLFIHPFIHLFNKYTYYITIINTIHYIYIILRNRSGGGPGLALRTLYTKLSSRDMKFGFFVSLSYVFVFVCVCVCLFGLLVCFALYFYHSE